MTYGYGLGSLVVGITLASGCCDEPQEPIEEPEELEEPPDYNEGRCFEPLRELTIDWSLATARWIHADVNDDGRGDLVAIALDSGPGWALHPLLGTADGEPFVQQPPVIVDVDFPLAEGRIVFADANGDDVADLATYHDGRIVIVEGPLQGAPQVVETPIEGLHWARGEFIDFDEDGVLDFVMREGTGDNLVSYRGLAEGGFELAGTAEFHQDTFCIDQILAEDRLDDWFVALGSDCGGVFASRLRVALFSVGDDGSMVELAAQEFDRDLFDRDLSLRMAGNLLGGFDHEVLINDSIWVVDEGSLVEQTQVSSTRRGDFNADGVIDHAENWEHAVDLRWGQSVGVGEPTLVFWDLVDRERESLELLESVDVDGDGRDEVIGLQKVGSEYSLLVGGTHVDCYDLR